MQPLLKNILLTVCIIGFVVSLYIYKTGRVWWIKGKVTEIEWFINRHISNQIQVPTASVRIIEAFPHLTFSEPMSIRFTNETSKEVFVAERGGRILYFNNDIAAREFRTLLDLSQTINTRFHKGLLDFIFYTDKNLSQYVYVLYNVTERQMSYLKLGRFKIDKLTKKVDKESEIQLFKVKAKDHQGGSLALDTNGYLYISIGDGLDTDPENNAQNLKVLNGKLLRIDINGEGAKPYTIPKDNPYYNNQHGYKQEIFASGFRNPFRFSIDSLTNTIFLGDVGQSDFEEVNIVTKGANYGWRILEANDCFNPGKDCNPHGLTSPIFSYPHGIEGFSITGGLVYRGKSTPELYGTYIYGDYVRGVIWALRIRENQPVENLLIAKKAGNITFFGQDGQKEIYYCDYSSGKIKKLVPIDI